MMELEVNIEIPKEKALALKEALSADRKSKRSEVTIGTKNGFTLKAKSEDAVAMRSVINTYLRLIDSCLKIGGD